MSPKTKSRIRTFVTVGFLLGAVLVLWMAANTLMATSGNKELFVFYTASKTNLPIVVTERGNLESQVQTTIRNKLENVTVDRSSGSAGTQIIFIEPNGSAVEEGQLIVEFDSATIRDRLDTQTLAVQKAVSAKIQAVAKYENQLIQNETTLAEAELAVQLAELDLKMYMDSKSGTFQLAKEEIERQIDAAKNDALAARAALELAKVDRTGMTELFRLGYRGKSDLDQSKLNFLQSEDKLASAVNQMKTHQGSRRKLTEYEFRMQKLTLEGAVATAERAMKQVVNDNESLAQQAEAAQDEAISTEQKEQERFQRLQEQLVNCKIFAPHGGMIVYSRDRRGGSEIMEGAMIHERQTIMTIPNLTQMQVKTQVHEAVLDQIKPGLPATVRVDAFPDMTYPAVVDKVAVVPSSDRGWMSSSSVKTYETTVKLIGEVISLKPGMTAVVNMHVDTVENVIAVPVQAVVQVDRENWCYVDSKNGVERRSVTIGRSNDKFVHIRDGLNEGERIVLNPMDIFEEQDESENEISPESGVPELSDEVREAAENAAKESEKSDDRRRPSVIRDPGSQDPGRSFGAKPGGGSGRESVRPGADGQRPAGRPPGTRRGGNRGDGNRGDGNGSPRQGGRRPGRGGPAGGS